MRQAMGLYLFCLVYGRDFQYYYTMGHALLPVYLSPISYDFGRSRIARFYIHNDVMINTSGEHLA